MSHPPVIVLMADQLRADALGPHTPHINALMSQSVCFERAYCASPLCVPARGAFFTGRAPNATGCLINPWRPDDARFGRVRAGVPTLYELLERDYDSWHVGKQHLLTVDGADSPASRTHWTATEKDYARFLETQNQRAPGGPSFRGLMPEMQGGRLTHAVTYSTPHTGCFPGDFEQFFDGFFTRGALDAIEGRDQNRPFALNLMFLAPHPPLEIPQPWYSLVQDQEVELPSNVGRWSEGQSPLQLYNLPGFIGSRYSREQWREVWRVYLGLVALLDHCVGLVIEALKREGLYDEALIVFTSDHGEMLGSHCLWQKMCLYEEAARVPLSFKLPGGRGAGTRSDALVSHLDVLPTLCELLELETPANLEGISLAPHIERGEAIERGAVFVQFDGNGARGNFQRGVVSGDWKLIVDLFKDEVFFELYDTRTDPQEERNRAWQEPERVRAMLRVLRDEMKRTSDLLDVPQSAFDEFLRERAAPTG